MTRILIVEDEGIIARDLQQTLQRMGYDVPEVCSMGEAAIPAAERLRPDIILMDIRLAGKMDGTEAATRIVAKQDVAIVFLTAYADEATLERATGSFPYGYLVKPYDESQLRAAVETALRRLEQDRRKEEHHTAVLDQLQEGVVLLDASGRFVYVNPAAQPALADARDAASWLGPDWREKLHQEELDVEGQRWHIVSQQIQGHVAVVLTPPAMRGRPRPKAAMAALQARMRDLI